MSDVQSKDETPVLGAEHAITSSNAATTTMPVLNLPATSEPVASEMMPTPVNTELGPNGAVNGPGKDVLVTAVPKREGLLGYKAPGFISQLRFKEHYFWLSDEPIAVEHLGNYLRGEKPEVAHHTAAWASQTGKGLFFFAKRRENKARPAGVLNLSEASDVTKEGIHDFSFKIHHHRHVFQAGNQDDRDSWVVAVETAAERARASRNEVSNGAAYKSSMANLGKSAMGLTPVVAGGSAARLESTDRMKKSSDGRRQSNSSEDNKSRRTSKSKSRSVSRNTNKRSSIFGSLLGKKEEHDLKKEERREERAEAKAEKKVDQEVVEEKRMGTKAESKEAELEEKASRKEDKVEIKAENKTLKEQEMSPEAVVNSSTNLIVPLTSPQDDITTIGTATQPNGVASTSLAGPGLAFTEPLSSQTETPLKPTTITPALNSSAKTAAKRNSIFASLLRKEMAPVVPPKDEDASAANITSSASVPSAETAAATDNIVPGPVAPAAAITATTAEPLSERRRSTFFSLGNGSTKQDRSVGAADAGTTTSDNSNSASTPLKGFSGLLRRLSSQTPRSVEREKKELAKPATLPEMSFDGAGGTTESNAITFSDMNNSLEAKTLTTDATTREAGTMDEAPKHTQTVVHATA